METTPDIIARNVEKTNIWFSDFADELRTDDRQYAYRVLRGFLHTLRDRLGVEEAAQLAAQMPDLIRGIYFEGWTPAKTPAKYRDVDVFLDRLANEALLHGRTEASFAASACARALRRHVSAGELDDVAAALPKEVEQLIMH
ncbi:MAG: DUF2267 domain-containing protein [Thermoleophilia bacterium]|nr:DUF2267 domain-containing protein [Thermoleophilia bacterium]